MNPNIDRADAPPVRYRHEAGADRPIPLRFWWLKRLTILGACLLAGLGGLRIWWGYTANRQYDAVVERFRADGQPVLVDEIDARLNAASMSQNAADLYIKAAQALVVRTTSGIEFYEVYSVPQRISQNPADAADMYTANRQALDLARQARDIPTVSWGNRLADTRTPNPVFFATGSMAEQFHLTKMLHFSLIYNLMRGHDDEAIETVLDMIHQADAIAQYPQGLAALSAWACQGMALTTLGEFSAQLTITCATGESRANGHAVRRTRIQELIATLLDEQESRRTAVACFAGDRASALDMVHPTRRDGNTNIAIFLGAPAGPWSRPAIVLDAVRAARVTDSAAQALRAPNWQAAEIARPVTSAGSSFFWQKTHAASDYLGNTVRHATAHYFEHLARRRMAAVALGTRLYAIDHGSPPAGLESLVPEYLPSLPIDPFSTDGSTFHYRPDAKRPMLYSVYKDGQDNDGIRITARRPDGVPLSKERDFCMYLEPERNSIEEDESDGNTHQPELTSN